MFKLRPTSSSHESKVLNWCISYKLAAVSRSKRTKSTGSNHSDQNHGIVKKFDANAVNGYHDSKILLNKRTGEPLYQINPPKSAADVYRERRLKVQNNSNSNTSPAVDSLSDSTSSTSSSSSTVPSGDSPTSTSSDSETGFQQMISLVVIGLGLAISGFVLVNKNKFLPIHKTNPNKEMSSNLGDASYSSIAYNTATATAATTQESESPTTGVLTGLLQEELTKESSIKKKKVLIIDQRNM